MATQLEKAVSSAAKHKAAFDELNAALGQSVVRPWEKMYADYYSGNVQVNIFQDTDDGVSIVLKIFLYPHIFFRFNSCHSEASHCQGG